MTASATAAATALAKPAAILVTAAGVDDAVGVFPVPPFFSGGPSAVRELAAAAGLLVR